MEKVSVIRGDTLKDRESLFHPSRFWDPTWMPAIGDLPEFQMTFLPPFLPAAFNAPSTLSSVGRATISSQGLVWDQGVAIHLTTHSPGQLCRGGGRDAAATIGSQPAQEVVYTYKMSYASIRAVYVCSHRPYTLPVSTDLRSLSISPDWNAFQLCSTYMTAGKTD